jgi:hypothetical protein
MQWKEKEEPADKQVEASKETSEQLEEELLAEGPYADQTIIDDENLRNFQSCSPEEKSEIIIDNQEKQNTKNEVQREEQGEEIEERDASFVTMVEEGFNDQTVIYEEEREEPTYQHVNLHEPSEEQREDKLRISTQNLHDIEWIRIEENNDIKDPLQFQEVPRTLKDEKIETEKQYLPEKETQLDESPRIKEQEQKELIEDKKNHQVKKDVNIQREHQNQIKEKSLEKNENLIDTDEKQKKTLATELKNFIESRKEFPSILYKYWLIQREEIEGKKPFIEVKLPNTEKIWYIPNRKYQWNPDFAYTYSPSATRYKDVSGAGMICKFFMEEIPIETTETQQRRERIVNQLRSQGYYGHQNPKRWFKIIYELTYKESIIDEVLTQTFWQEHTNRPHWKDPVNIERYTVFKKILNYYEKAVLTRRREEEYQLIPEKSTQQNRYKNEIIPKIVRGLSKEGLQMKDPALLEAIKEIRKSKVFKDIGFIGKDNKWVVEVEWVGREIIKPYLCSLASSFTALRLWAEIMTDEPVYNESDKKLFYTLDLRHSTDKFFLNRYVNKKILIFNSSSRFGKQEGMDRGSIYGAQTLTGFIDNFLEKLIIPKSIQNEVYEFLFAEFSKKYGGIFERFVNSKRRKVIYGLKFNVDELNNSWIKEFYHWKQNHTNLLQFEDRKAQRVLDYYDRFSYSPSLKGEPIDYAISISEVTYTQLLGSLKKNKIDTIKDIYYALSKPRERSTQFTNLYFGTKDVKPPLIVKTINDRYFKKETKPDGQVAIIQALFQDESFVNYFNKSMTLQLPINGEYKFKGQTRGKKSTTTVYEDVSAVTDIFSANLKQEINILIKNSTERDQRRLIEDYLKSLFSPNDRSLFIQVSITHPIDLNDQKFHLPLSVEKAFKSYQDGRRLGWIDIGVYKGDKKLKNLSQIYGAVKYVRSSWKGRKKSDLVIARAKNKLKEHNVKQIDQDKIRRMNSLFDRHNLWNNPRNLPPYAFRDFTIDLVESFLREK